MKKDLHPDNYRLVVFQDTSTGFSFLTRSTAVSNDTTTWEDGQDYPLIKVHISSDSHPFYTGQEKLVDVEGRVDRFKARRAAADAKRAESSERRQKKATKAPKKAARPTAKASAKDASPEPLPQVEKAAAKAAETPAK